MLERAVQYYSDAWSNGRVLVLNDIMAEGHEQHDVVWQPLRVGAGRRAMKRGILAYRAAYPDLNFRVKDCAASHTRRAVFVWWDASGTNTGPVRDQPPSHQRTTFSGITALQFDSDCRIQSSHVYRQAPADEAAYFQTSGQPVPTAPPS